MKIRQMKGGKMNKKIYALLGLFSIMLLTTATAFSFAGLHIAPNKLNLGKLVSGQTVYSKNFLLKNHGNANYSLSISGTDIFDISNMSSACPSTNSFQLENIAYFAKKGAYSTLSHPNADSDGFVQLQYADFSLMGNETADILHPRENVAITFRVDVPEDCNGEFTAGQIKITGEAGNQTDAVYLPVKMKVRHLSAAKAIAFQ